MSQIISRGLQPCSCELSSELYLESERRMYFRTLNFMSFVKLCFKFFINLSKISLFELPTSQNYCKFEVGLSLETKNNFTILDMIPKPTNASKCAKVYYTHDISPTCFGHSCCHFQD
jgi:hypothetical protein